MEEFEEAIFTEAKFCGRCGAKLLEGARFCASCGAAVPSVMDENIATDFPVSTGANYFETEETVAESSAPFDSPLILTPDDNLSIQPMDQQQIFEFEQNEQTGYEAQGRIPIAPEQPIYAQPAYLPSNPQREALRKKGFVMITCAVGIFIIASIIQALVGSSMFSDTYYIPDSALLDALVYPSWMIGWFGSIGLVAYGILNLFKASK